MLSWSASLETIVGPGSVAGPLELNEKPHTWTGAAMPGTEIVLCLAYRSQLRVVPMRLHVESGSAAGDAVIGVAIVADLRVTSAGAVTPLTGGTLVCFGAAVRVLLTDGRVAFVDVLATAVSALAAMTVTLPMIRPTRVARLLRNKRLFIAIFRAPCRWSRTWPGDSGAGQRGPRSADRRHPRCRSWLCE